MSIGPEVSPDNIDPPLPGEGEGGLPEVPYGDDITQQKMEDALRAITKSWLSKLTQARKHKAPFSSDAREGMQFFDGHGDWFWKGDNFDGPSMHYSKIGPPSFRMVINKSFECVKLFGSVIYHRNPQRTCTPRKFPAIPPQALGINPDSMNQVDPATGQPFQDPQVDQYMMVSDQVSMMDQQKEVVADLVASYLNYTPVELDLKENSRKVVDEAIIKGMGLWWTELVELDGVDQQERPYAMVGSFFDSVDNFLIDPDADEQEDILWCARRCVHPIDEVARKYNIPKEELKGHMESYVSQSRQEERDYKMKRKNGKTNDLIVYWKIYSKTGFGHTLKGFPKEFEGIFDNLGDNTYIVVADGVPFPLNAPKEIVLEQPDETGLPNGLFTRTRWPIPFYTEKNNGWPFTPLQFHRKPGYSWPISHLKPGLPELRFLNWALSFLATRVMTSCKTMVGVAKAAGDDIKDQILKHEESGFTLIELSETLGKTVDELISIFQLPGVSPELHDLIAAVSEMFDKRVGLTELVYGMTRSQFRSAAEAQVKSEQISVRPDDMANVLEDSMSAVARKEALAARWLLGPEDVAPILGPLGAEVWKNSVMNMSVGTVAREFDYRIEAGSARKPNKAGEVERMQMAVQTMGPILQSFASMGQVEPLNALMQDWAKSLDIDPSRYVIQPPPPPEPQNELPPGSGDGGGGTGEEPPPEEPPA